MDEEIKAIEKNSTWELTTLPKNKEVIGVKWAHKSKKNMKGDLNVIKLGWLSKITIKKLRLIMMRYTHLLLILKLCRTTYRLCKEGPRIQSTEVEKILYGLKQAP